jgi:hypothetical protein
MEQKASCSHLIPTMRVGLCCPHRPAFRGEAFRFTVPCRLYYPVRTGAASFPTPRRLSVYERSMRSSWRKRGRLSHLFIYTTSGYHINQRLCIKARRAQPSGFPPPPRNSSHVTPNLRTSVRPDRVPSQRRALPPQPPRRASRKYPPQNVRRHRHRCPSRC